MQVSKNSLACGVSVAVALIGSGEPFLVETKLHAALAWLLASTPIKPNIEINNAALTDLKPNISSP
jgi:hypothetical protein